METVLASPGKAFVTIIGELERANLVVATGLYNRPTVRRVSAHARLRTRFVLPEIILHTVPRDMRRSI
jgi:hypothetical protein